MENWNFEPEVSEDAVEFVQDLIGPAAEVASDVDDLDFDKPCAFCGAPTDASFDECADCFAEEAGVAA